MSDHAQTRPKRLFGRRQGHALTARQRELFASLLPKIQLVPAKFIDGRPYGCPPDKAMELEIGFGGGEHLVFQAKAHPETTFMGCEPFVNGVAKLLVQIEEQNLDNILIYPGDIYDILAQFGPSSLCRVFILFPDPWPKKRHNKRRIISKVLLDELARTLKSGAVIRFASDIDDYVDWCLRHFMAHPAFEWCAQRPQDWRIRPKDWPETRYEKKALGEGRRSSYLEFRRIDDDESILAKGEI